MARLILRRLSFLCDGLRVHGSERRQWAGRLIQRAGVIRRMRRLRVRQLLECATRDLAVRVDRQRTFQALTPPFRSLGDGCHPQPGGFVAWIDAQRLGEERSSPRFVAGANGGDSVDNDAMDVGRNGM